MLWTEKYRPRIPEDIIGQEQVVKQLGLCARTGSVPHMMLTGQHGTGKTSSIECFARQLYGENWQMNTSIFQTADLFIEGKNYLEQDDRYFHLYQKQASLLANFKYIIKSYAALRPLNADFKLMVFEDAHAMTREAQQALRRIMERTSATCRFVLTTTNPSAIICRRGGFVVRPFAGVTSPVHRYFDLSLPVCAVSFGPIHTPSFLGSQKQMDRVDAAFPTKEPEDIEDFFRLSRTFAKRSGLITPEIQEVLGCCDRKGVPASMTMLGNGVFAYGKGAREVLSGFGRTYELRVAQNGPIILEEVV